MIVMVMAMTAGLMACTVIINVGTIRRVEASCREKSVRRTYGIALKVEPTQCSLNYEIIAGLILVCGQDLEGVSHTPNMEW